MTRAASLLAALSLLACSNVQVLPLEPDVSDSGAPNTDADTGRQPGDAANDAQTADLQDLSEQGGDTTWTDQSAPDTCSASGACPDGTGPETDADTDTDTDTDTVTGADTETGADTDTGPDADTGVDTETGPDTDTGPDTSIEPDADSDGVPDETDNCPGSPNPDQADSDGDGVGDACEPDIDTDGVPDDTDNCPVNPNPDQSDGDGDGVGDACEADGDQDGIPDDSDNCPDIGNGDQSDSDGDGTGDACEPDADGDGIPDDGDLFPDDSALPGVADTSLLYAHTSTKLFEFDAASLTLTELGTFNWPADGGSHSMTDLALDSYGTIFGVSFSHLYTCHPDTVSCTSLGALPGSYNGLTMIPPGILDPNLDVLVAVTTGGQWYRLDVTGGQVSATLLGSYGPGYTSSGDAYAIAGVGTFAAVNLAGSVPDVLVALDPVTGTVAYEIGPIGTYGSVWGLAGWLGRAYAFDSSGDVLQIDLTSGVVTPVLETNHSWWGAGVATQSQ